jgi:ribosomal protein L27
MNKFSFDNFLLHDQAEFKSNQMCHKVCRWIKKHGKSPSQHSKDPIEKRLGIWLFNQRQAKAGKGTSKFYESNLVIAKKYVLPDLFEQIDLEQESNEKCHECCKWIKKHGKNPSKRSKDPIEKNLGLWLSTQRQAKAGKGKSKFYLSNQAIVESDKLPNLFTRK